MRTLRVQITDRSALKALNKLEKKQVIKIIDDSDPYSPALAGAPLSLKALETGYVMQKRVIRLV